MLIKARSFAGRGWNMRIRIPVFGIAAAFVILATSASFARDAVTVATQNIANHNSNYVAAMPAQPTGSSEWTNVSETPSTHYQICPEASSFFGFGAALVLNGLGVAGSGYFLRRKYNRESARRYAVSKTTRMPVFLDAAVSVVLLLMVSPALIAITALGALRTGRPTVYGRSG